ncbi:MAG: outer membrane protein assembly factor BamE [Burkholderiales bacterium]|nr:outer membrane protein assembly factor BamE [Burkholderiales bacterium]
MKHLFTRFSQASLMACASLALAACATAGVGQAFTAEQVASIKPGMTVEQVSGMLGSPQHTSITPYGTMHSWVYVAPVTITPIPFGTHIKPETKQVSINFIDGKVAPTPK